MISNSENMASSSENIHSKSGQSLENMPSFEEHMRKIENSSPTSPNIEQPVNPEIEQIMKDAVKKRVASGEFSKLYSYEKANGQTRTIIESQYFDIAKNFIRSQKQLKKDLNLSTIMASMSHNLALIDVTQGRNLLEGDKKSQNSLSKNYNILRNRLDDPQTSAEEKQLISDYFQVMRGDALSILEKHYHSNLGKDRSKQQEEDDAEKFMQNLNKIKNRVKFYRRALDVTSSEFDYDLKRVNQLVEGRIADLDYLNSSFTKLLQSQEVLEGSANYLNNLNDEYTTFIVRGEEYLDKDVFWQDIIDIENNNKAIKMALSKANNEERINYIRFYINEIEKIEKIIKSF